MIYDAPWYMSPSNLFTIIFCLYISGFILTYIFFFNFLINHKRRIKNSEEVKLNLAENALWSIVSIFWFITPVFVIFALLTPKGKKKMKILNLFKKKRKLTRVEVLKNQFDSWKAEALQLKEGSIADSIPERLYLKNGDWFFNDYFDMKYSPDVARMSQRFMREATKKEINIYSKFQSLIDSLSEKGDSCE
jgi:heme/copper-type cytochrome/quinol oxidase subunit 2